MNSISAPWPWNFWNVDRPPFSFFWKFYICSKACPTYSSSLVVNCLVFCFSSPFFPMADFLDASFFGDSSATINGVYAFEQRLSFRHDFVDGSINNPL